MATNRANTGESYVIMLPAVKRLWKHHQATSEAIFSSAHNARRIVEGFARRPPHKGTLADAKVMRICSPSETGAIWHDGRWLIDT